MLFTFPSRYWFTIGGKACLALGGGPPGFPQGFSCPAVLGYSLAHSPPILRGSHPLWRAFPGRFEQTFCGHVGSPTTPSQRTGSVWAGPRSLAATRGIASAFFSSGYLDVSVPRVPSVQLWIGCTVTTHYGGRVSPFGDLRIIACLQLP